MNRKYFSWNALGHKLVRLAISHIRSWTSLLTGLLVFWLITRETVEIDTPASAAISLSVIGDLLSWLLNLLGRHKDAVLLW